MNIEITSTRSISKPSWGIKHFVYHTNSNHDVSVIDDNGGFEIIVFDKWDHTEKQEWIPTVDEMIQRFSALVAEYTLVEVQS